MKKFISLFILFFSLTTFAQSMGDQTVIQRSLYTNTEKETIFENFKKDIPTIGMTAEVEKMYSDIISSNFTKMVILNKDKNNTKKELKQRLKRVLEDQKVELKKMLTYDQFKRHQQIYKPIIVSIRSRIDNYEIR